MFGSSFAALTWRIHTLQLAELLNDCRKSPCAPTVALTELHLATNRGMLPLMRRMLAYGALRDICPRRETLLLPEAVRGLRQTSEGRCTDSYPPKAMNLQRSSHACYISHTASPAGADVNARDGEHGYTPLMIASARGDVGAITLLCEAGADGAYLLRQPLRSLSRQCMLPAPMGAPRCTLQPRRRMTARWMRLRGWWQRERASTCSTLLTSPRSLPPPTPATRGACVGCWPPGRIRAW